jgi:pimeloyl-ACP methyl ester carboxylesterase
MLAIIESMLTKVSGRDVRYYKAGQGEPLLVVHGGGGDAATWLDNILELSENYTVYAPDLPGFGGSQALDGDCYVPELTTFISDFSDNLGLDSFHIIGHSIGGGIALNYALESPHRIKKLILISSLCMGHEIALWVRILSLPARYIGSVLKFGLRGVKWIFTSLLAPFKLVIPLTSTSLGFGKSISNFKEQTLVFANRFSEIMIPTLLVWGAKDPIVPVKHAYAAAEVIPDCRIKVFENRGHNVHRDEIDQFSSIVNRFLG